MKRIGYFPGSDAKNNVHSFLDQHLKEKPDLVVLRWVDPADLKAWITSSGANPSVPLKHQSMTVREMHDRISHIAAGLTRLGIHQGDRAIVFVSMSPQLYLAMFALQKIGAIPVFLDSWARRAHLGASAKIVNPRVIVSFEKAFELCRTVPELAEIPIQISVGPTTGSYNATLEQLLHTPEESRVVAVQQEDTALVTFTTGSSGTPKGANRTHRFLAAQHYALNAGLPYGAADIDLPVFPIFSLNNLASGVSTIIPAFDIGTPGEFDPQILLAQLRSCGVSCTTLSPYLFRVLADYCLKNQISLPGLRRAVTGGAPVSRDNVVAFTSIAPRADVWVLFGSTEVEPMAHIEAKEMIALKTRVSEDPEWVDEGVNVGHFAEGLEYRFLKTIRGPIEVSQADDWKNILVAPGEVGELIVAGEHVCQSYYNDVEAFLRTKIRDENGVVWHRTGDLGKLDSEGNLWIVGRVHNVIQRGGRALFPVQAEMIMKKLPFVRLSAFLGIPDSTLGEKTVCVIAPYKQADLGDPALLTSYRGEVERLMKKNEIPVDLILFQEEIPMDARHHSKVEYDVLRKQLEAEV